MSTHSTLPPHVRVLRKIPWQEKDGRVVLMAPRFETGFIGRLLRRLIGEGTLPVKLDALGSFVWKQCDGEVPLERIVASLEEAFGEEAENAEARVRMLLAQLYQENWIAYFVREEK
jgi:hypothetical protein